MAELSESQFSLISLEDELTCSICLSTFDCPVTIPCGHNFCQDCLLATWKDSYSCPQCRTHFSTKPELKKNTVLSTVVETFVLRTNRSEAGLVVEESKAEKKDVLRCDTCMEAEASKTCLTCMASFCDEHLRPHRENPTFRLHQLSEPVGDLSERICPDHHKLMELFCSQHGRPICNLCLQQVHKGCTFVSPEEQRNLLEASFDLPKAVKCDAHVPRITLDSKKVTATQTFAAALREHLTEILNQPVEARLLILKQEVPEPPEQKNMPSSHSPGCPPVQPLFQPIPVPVYIGSQAGWNLPQHHPPGVYRGPRFTGQKTKQDKRPPSASGGNNQSGKGSDFKKKDKPRSHPSSEKSTKPHPQPHKNK